jgi:hypothetical protein
VQVPAGCCVKLPRLLAPTTGDLVGGAGAARQADKSSFECQSGNNGIVELPMKDSRWDPA